MFHARPPDQIGAVESVKAASDIYAPVSGEVIEANGELEGSPSLINEEPYGKGWLSPAITRDVDVSPVRSHFSFSSPSGWLCKLKVSDPAELDGLMDEAAYEKHTAAE